MFCLVGISYLANSSKSRHVLIAGFFFSLAAMTRSTGVLLSVFIAYKMLPKILYTPNCCKIFKYIMVSWICAIMMLLPMLVF